MLDPVVITPDLLGFASVDPDALISEAGAWRKDIGGRTVTFRRLRSLADLEPIENLQRAVFAGIADRDLWAAGMLVTVAETGGAVVSAAVAGWNGDDELVGFAIGWGGFHSGRPRILSDMLGVRPGFRGGGLGAELKKLQAALAIVGGFVEMVWTVDPLRAANARLNFEKLGAYAARYEIDRYGAEFAADLYGGLPTDRLHITWPLTSPEVRGRLLGHVQPRSGAEVEALSVFDPIRRDGAVEQEPARVLVPLPADIDQLVVADPAAAMRWRLELRETLMAAFAQGYVITGFAPAAAGAADPTFVLMRP